MQQATVGNNSNIKQPRLQRQSSFGSTSPGVIDEVAEQSEPITRSEQAKHQYGLECLAASIMYMIQSYGLVPPGMSRQEFEHAFTPLTPTAHGSSKIGWIKVDSKEQISALPVDLFSDVLEGTPNPSKTNNNSLGYPATKTEATLQGAKRGGFQADYVVKKLTKILSTFDAQSKKPGYEFMRAHRLLTEAFKPDAKDEWVATDDLKNNTIDDEYFQKGNTLLVELCLIYPATP